MTEQSVNEEPVVCACGRPLRDPVSIARQTGPVCWRRLHGPPPPRPRIPRPAAQPGHDQPELPYDDQLPLWQPQPTRN